MKRFLLFASLLLAIAVRAQRTEPVVVRCGTTPGFETLSDNYNVDSIAKWHNDALSELLAKGAQYNICLRARNFLEKFNEAYRDFFATKGVIMDAGSGAVTNDPQAIKDYYDNYDFSAAGYSADATTLLVELQQKLEDYKNKAITLQEFVNYCDQKRTVISQLSDPVEVKSLGVAFAIAKQSELFWDANIQTFVNQFGGAGCSEGIIHCGTTERKIPWGGVAYADVSGAINGGRIGAVAAGGIPGAVAGGLMGAGIGSGLRLLSFAIFGD